MRDSVRSAGGWLVGILTVGLTTVAIGQVTTYTNEADFLAALAAGGVTNSFPDGPVGNYTTPAPPLSYAQGNPYAPYTIWASAGLFGDNYTIGGRPVQGIGNFSFSNPVVIDFTGHNVSQVGASFFFTDFFGAAYPGDVVVNFFDGSSTTVPLVTGNVPTNTGSSGGPNFFGVTVASASQAIRRIEIPRFPIGTEAYINMGPLTTAAFPDIALLWSGSGAAASLGGGGQWSSAGANWATGPASIGAWTSARRAVFTGAAGAVTVAAGGTTVARGLAFSTDGYSLDGPGTVTLSGASSDTNDVYVGPGASATVAASLTAAAGYTKSGPGTLVVTGTASGPATIARGVLQVGDGGSAGVLAAATVINNGELEFNRSDAHSFAGSIAGSGAVYVTGSGRTTLSGVGTYSGDTGILSPGTLAIGSGNAVAGSFRVNTAAVGTFDVTAVPGGYAVPGSQTVAGGGFVDGDIAFGGGATVSPGVGRGTLTLLDAVTLGAGGNYNWQVDDASGAAGLPDSYDLLSIGGPLSITATAQSPFVVNLWSVQTDGASAPALGFDPAVSSTFTLATATGGISGFAPNKFAIRTDANNGTAGFVNDLAGGRFRIAQSGNDLQLVFDPAGTGPSDIVIDVASGIQTQSQAGYPAIDSALSVTKTGSGTLVFDAANAYSGPTTVSGGTLRVANAEAVRGTNVTVDTGATLAVALGTTMRSPAVIVDGGTLSATTLAVNGTNGIASLAINAGTLAGGPTVTITGGGGMSLVQDARVTVGVGGLEIDQSSSGGRLDLGAGAVTIAAGGISAADLRADIIAGRNGGAWNGATGVMSSTAAAAAGGRAVGYVVNADGSATVSFAAPGDVDLSGAVNVFDLVSVNSAGKYGTGAASVWNQGDFNYDGVTNVFDLVGVNTAGVYGKGNYFPAAPSGTGAISAVPEPGPLGILGACLLSLSAGHAWRRRPGPTTRLREAYARPTSSDLPV
jgi:autotransporter-associated beta strand protein